MKDSDERFVFVGVESKGTLKVTEVRCSESDGMIESRNVERKKTTIREREDEIRTSLFDDSMYDVER